MADNIEKDAANNMASSERFGGFSKMRNLTNILMGKARQSGASTSSGGGSGGGGTGNGWTAEDYKNYGEYREGEHRRGAETDANREVLKNASRDAKMIRKNTNEDRRQARDQENITHAAKYGQVASIDSVNGKKRNTVRFAATPVRQTNPGTGVGAQGTSKQQTSGKGAAAGRVVGAAIGGAVTKNPKGVTAGSTIGAKLGDAIESKVINRTPKA